MRRRNLTPRVEPLDARLAPTALLPNPGTPPIVFPSPRPIGPAGPAYSAAVPYAPSSPY